MSRIKSLYEPFQRWQERGNIIIFSDPHWGESDCLLMDENWPKPKEHVELLLQGVHNSDTVVCLGDIGDPIYIKYIRYDGALMISPQILLSHEPVDLPFAVNIHGHVHGGEFHETDWDGRTTGYNLAADVAKWQPFNLNEYVHKGMLRDTPTIHRLTIDKATARKRYRDENYAYTSVNESDKTCANCANNVEFPPPHTCDVCTSLDEEMFCMWEKKNS